MAGSQIALEAQNHCAAPAGHEHSNSFLQEQRGIPLRSQPPCFSVVYPQEPTSTSAYSSQNWNLSFSLEGWKWWLCGGWAIGNLFKNIWGLDLPRMPGNVKLEASLVRALVFLRPHYQDKESSSREHLSDFSSLMGLLAYVPWCVKILGNKLR